MPGPMMAAQDLHVLRNRNVGVCQFLQLTEENVRFLLLAVFLYVYLCLGAFMFQAVEESAENEIRGNYEILFNEFRDNLSLLNEEVASFGSDNSITEQDLLRLLRAYGDASKAGVFSRKRWDWVGSFHFAWTVVSTIGYGVTSPATSAGQLLIIPYGFFGCASGLLFFNLFLERIITFLSTCMRYYRLQRQKRRSYVYGGGNSFNFPNGRRGSHSSTGNGSTAEEDSDWKPSVYMVMLCLFFMSALIISCSAGMFHSMEGWTYVESLYFSFVSYATIGFGDFVSLQLLDYGKFELVYRVAAFTTMVLGCCCIYSLLNVVSIVIKQSLNWLIKKMDDWRCCSCCNCLQRTVRRNFSVKRMSRRNNNSRGDSKAKRPSVSVAVLKIRNNSSNNDDQTQPNSIDMEERRYSGENMISIRGELNNKVSLAVMQKRLYETAQMSRSTIVSHHDNAFSARSVGPLAIVTEKLEDHHC